MTEIHGLLSEMKEEVEKCVNCGFCESVCPTLPASGFRSTMGARGRVDLGKAFIAEMNNAGGSELKISDSFYSCLDCFACLQVCPAGVNAGKVSGIGREIAAIYGQHALEKPVARMIVETTMKFMNPLGVREKCAGWAKGLAFDSDSETLLYTGNMYQLIAYSSSLGKLKMRLGEKAADFMAGIISRHPAAARLSGMAVDRRMRRQMDAFLRDIYFLLASAGLKFNYLGVDEPYPGTFIYDLGYRDKFLEYGRRIISIFRYHNVRTIITVDPHTYDILNVQYRKYFSDFDFRVVHYLDYLRDVRFAGNGERVTLHEPCHFTLREGNYSGPSELVSGLAQLTFPERSGKRTMCCGGPDELLFGEISGKISEERFSQLKSTGAERIITACPICFANLRKDRTVIDISQFLVERLEAGAVPKSS